MASWLASKVGGAFHKGDAPHAKELSSGAAQLIEQAFDGFDSTSPVVDYRAHLYGRGTSSGCSVHPDVNQPWRHPLRAARMKLIESGAGIDNQNKWDVQYVDRFLSLIDGVSPKPWGRTHLLALDQFMERNGDAVPQKTGMYVPNDYLIEVTNKNPGEFVPVVSINPYRKTAIEEINKWAQVGVRFISWIPSSMNIDPTDDQCLPFYKAMVSRGMILLVQCGTDGTFDSPGVEATLGNPLLLRSALGNGVKVIVANCGGEGKSLDMDKPMPHPLEDNVKLFLRLMDEPQYDGLLFGDLAGISAFGRIDCLVAILDRPDLHRRLVYGSDYPMPAINLVVQTYWHANRGLLTEDQSEWLGEIYKFNPLIFDFVLKRTLRSPKTGNRFDIRVFKDNAGLRSGVKSSYTTTTVSSPYSTFNNTHTTSSNSNNNIYNNTTTANNQINSNTTTTPSDLDSREDFSSFNHSKNEQLDDAGSEGTPHMSSTSEVSAVDFENDEDDTHTAGSDVKDSDLPKDSKDTDLLKDSGLTTSDAGTSVTNTPANHALVFNEDDEDIEEEVSLDD